MKNLKPVILAGFLGGFVMPPAMWLVGLAYLGVVSLDELVQVALSPLLWIYVVGYCLLVFWLVNRRLDRIAAYLAAPDDDKLAAAQSSLAWLPGFYLGANVIYGLISPNTGMWGHAFLTTTEYVLGELIAIPIIFLFALPFYGYTVAKLEEWTTAMPFRQTPLLSLNFKLALNILVTALGLQALFIVGNVTLVSLSTETLEALRATLLTKNLVIGLCGLAIVIVDYLIVLRIVNPVRQIVVLADGLSEGDLAQTLTIHSRDEIGEVGTAFMRTVAYLQQMAGVAGKIAEGDLSGEVEAQSERDLLGQTFAQMLANLRHLVGQVAENAASVSAASSQLETAASRSSQATQQIMLTIRQMTQGATQQSDSVGRTANSVEEMKRAIDGVAKGAQDQANSVAQVTAVMGQLSDAMGTIQRGATAQTRGMERATVARASLAEALQQVGAATTQVAAEAQQAAHSAEEGTSLITQTVSGIQQVRTATEQLAERVRGLGQQSAQIGTIVETIEDIASQTNLLALNAAIEAARAGEHGKGFAVVADEVRKLAERSSTATKEIAAMIRTIQGETGEAVQAMGQAAADVSAAVKLTDQAGAAFRDIAEKSQASAAQMLSVREAVDAMRQSNTQLEQAVAEALAIAQQNQQAAETVGRLNGQMVTSLDAVSAVVEENTASTEQMAAGSTEVAEAIGSIATVSGENDAAVQEVNAGMQLIGGLVESVRQSAHSLAGMAQALQALVTRFNLGAALDGAAPAREVQPKPDGRRQLAAGASRNVRRGSAD